MHEMLVEDCIEQILKTRRMVQQETEKSNASAFQKSENMYIWSDYLASVPTICERAEWGALPVELREAIIADGEKALAEPWPVILMSDYLRFSKDGNRSLFEDKYFTRRRMLTKLTLAECVENKGRFLPKILDGIYLILGETAWQLPAHNAYIRDTKQFSVPDTTRPVVDLFAAETAAILGVAEYLLREPLKAISPFIEITLDNALYDRIFFPYLHFHFWWMGNGLEPMCNWTPWITQNILLSVFTRDDGKGRKVQTSTLQKAVSDITQQNKASDVWKESNEKEKLFSTEASEPLELEEIKMKWSNAAKASPVIAEKFLQPDGHVDPPDWPTTHTILSKEEKLQILRQAAKSIDYFLNEYALDGCCDEGAQYYSHAGLTMLGCLELFYEIFGGKAPFNEIKIQAGVYKAQVGKESKIEELFQNTKIRSIGEYIVKMVAGDNYYINFSDCSPRAGRRTAREYLFGKRLGSRTMEALAAKDLEEESMTERLLPMEENLWYHILQIFAYKEMLAASTQVKKSVQKAETSLSLKNGMPDRQKEETLWQRTEEESIQPADSYFESTGLLVTRDNHFTLAIKAGDNADSHNHNDVGSFTLYRDGKPLIIDLGVGTYTRKTFSKDRYDIWTMQSRYHNLPTFLTDEALQKLFASRKEELMGTAEKFTRTVCRNVCGTSTMTMDAKDIDAEAMTRSLFQERETTVAALEKAGITMEKPGDTAKAIDVSLDTKQDPEILCFTMDIAPAYETPQIRSMQRTCIFQKNQSITIEDHWDADLRPVFTLMTYNKPEIVEEECRNICTISVGDQNILIKGVQKAMIEPIPITDARLGETWKHDCYRLLLLPLGNKLETIFGATQPLTPVHQFSTG